MELENDAISVIIDVPWIVKFDVIFVVPIPKFPIITELPALPTYKLDPKSVEPIPTLPAK